jgi:RNA polymerase sigma-70 factor (ECF subfamily)
MALMNEVPTQTNPAAAIDVAVLPGSGLRSGDRHDPDLREARELRLRGLIDDYIDFVARVLRNAGTPESDVDDEVQRTFIVVANRLDDVRPGCERSFLLRIALNLAAHARRTVARRREVGADEAPEMVDGAASAEQLTDRKRARVLLDRVLDRMDGDLRTVFVLHEIEEMSMSEIADALQIPAGTVASRLRRARVDLREQLQVIERAWQREGGET